MPPVHESTEQAQYLTFYLAGEEYAIGILRVKEILEYGTVTPVPTAPRAVAAAEHLMWERSEGPGDERLIPNSAVEPPVPTALPLVRKERKVTP